MAFAVDFFKVLGKTRHHGRSRDRGRLDSFAGSRQASKGSPFFAS
jgi:hypothetical protein